jgi:hypothetical protein
VPELFLVQSHFINGRRFNAEMQQAGIEAWQSEQWKGAVKYASAAHINHDGTRSKRGARVGEAVRSAVFSIPINGLLGFNLSATRLFSRSWLRKSGTQTHARSQFGG